MDTTRICLWNKWPSCSQNFSQNASWFRLYVDVPPRAHLFPQVFLLTKTTRHDGICQTECESPPSPRRDNAHFNTIQPLHCIITLLSMQNNAHIAPEVVL